MIASPIPPALKPQDAEDAEDGALTFAHGNAGHEAQHLFCSGSAPLATDPA